MSDPTRTVAMRRDHLSWRAAPLDRRIIDGERMRSRPGRLHGGWRPDDPVGSLGGGPGDMRW